ncbi:MAG: hypothetical protein LBT55_06240 [Clostridiaceae bacterium]|jgi:hypothetical protein|nr:hypothetical protein [Clostridiaceae bacterium]
MAIQKNNKKPFVEVSDNGNMARFACRDILTSHSELADRDDAKYILSLQGAGSSSIILELSAAQVQLYMHRRTRTFLRLCTLETLTERINEVKSLADLHKVARRYGLCDYCDFQEINLNAAKHMLCVIAEILFDFPKLRGNVCYIGSEFGYRNMAMSLCSGVESALKQLGLHYILTQDVAKEFGSLILEMLTQHDGVGIASARSVFGLFDAIILDEGKFKDFNYIKLISTFRDCEERGFWPRGCNSADSVFYHEIGHLLDFMFELSEAPEILRYYNRLTEGQIKSGLSEYATHNMREFIAEAFAEYRSNPMPREIALYIGKFISRRCKEV